jgi:hypothetical protein
MPKESRALTRTARARMATTGETYTQARAGILAPRMDRDTPPDNRVAALMFGELMAAGKRAATAGPGGLAAAAAAVQAAITPLWPRVVPEAARDVLVACAELAVTRGVTALPAGIADETAAGILELAAASSSPALVGGFIPHVAYASSAAFDRDEDAATLSAVALLIAVAHPAAPGGHADDVGAAGVAAEELGWGRFLPVRPRSRRHTPKRSGGRSRQASRAAARDHAITARPALSSTPPTTTASWRGRLVHADRYPGSMFSVIVWEDAYQCDSCGEACTVSIDLPSIPWGEVRADQMPDGPQHTTVIYPGVRHPGFPDIDDEEAWYDDGVCPDCGNVEGECTCYDDQGCPECGAGGPGDPYGECVCYPEQARAPRWRPRPGA